MNNQRNEVLFWLSIPIIVLVVFTSFLGVFFNEITYMRETLSWTAQGIGQDIVSLVIVVPALIASSILMRKGSQKALLVLMGGLLYTLYSYTLYSFYIHFGSLFLPYVAIMGLSFYSFVFALINFDLNRIKSSLTEKTPVKYVVYFLNAFAILFALLWLKSILSAYITGSIPQDIVDIGMPSNAVWVLDLALLLPGVAIVANMLNKKKLIGFVLAPVILVFSALMGCAIFSMMVVMKTYFISLSYPVLILVAILVLASLYLLKVYLDSLKKA